MKERPTIFSGPMVQAILDGKKTHTRRVVNEATLKVVPRRAIRGWPAATTMVRGDIKTPATMNRHGAVSAKATNGERLGLKPEEFDFCCPHCDGTTSLVDGKWHIGPKEDSRLWVRETWADVNTPDGPAILYRADGSYQHWGDFSTVFGKDYGAGPSMNYEAYPGEYIMWWEDLLNGAPEHTWRSPIHMFRWASRIDLEITGVRLERLQDITEEDAIKEGAVWVDTGKDQWGQQRPGWSMLRPHPARWEQCHPSARMAFGNYINTLHGGKNWNLKPTNLWDQNPWAWVVEFKKMEPVTK